MDSNLAPQARPSSRGRSSRSIINTRRASCHIFSIPLQGILLLLGMLALGCAKKESKMDAAMLAEGQKGVQLYEQGKYEDALAVFKKMERQIPTDHQVHLCAASLQTLPQHRHACTKDEHRHMRIDAMKIDAKDATTCVG